MARNTVPKKQVESKRSARQSATGEQDAVVVTLSLRDEHKRITRERLISAAEDLFQRQGFRATSVEQITRAAGTTGTTFYRHFKSKSDLVVIVQDNLTQEVRAVLERLDAIRRPTRTQIRSWLDDYFAMWRRNHMLCDAYWEATATDPDLAKNILPVSMGITSTLHGFLGRFPDKLKRRAQLRLAVQVLLLDRVAYLVETRRSVSEAKELLDEFADILWVSVYELTD